MSKYTTWGEIIVPLPFNRSVRVYDTGHPDGVLEGYWMDTGEEITDVEFNTEVMYLYKFYYLHEWLQDFVIWKPDNCME